MTVMFDGWIYMITQPNRPKSLVVPAALIFQFLSLVLLSLHLRQEASLFLAEQRILGLQRGQLGLDGQQFFCC